MAYVARLNQLIDLAVAWDQDEERLSRSGAGDKPSAIGPIVAGLLEAFIVELETHPASSSQETLKELAGVFDGRVSHKGAWTTRNALNRVVRTLGAVAPTRAAPVERLQVALLQAGCWPDLQPLPPETPDRKQGRIRLFSPWWGEVLKASEHHQPAVLRWLFKNPLASEAIATLSPFPTSQHLSRRLPEGFRRAFLCVWPWVVHQTGLETVDAWLGAGADPNGCDLAGNPVLAYANQAAIAQRLLDAGADPLAPHLSVQTRRQNLTALTLGWAEPGDYHRDPAVAQRWQSVFERVERRVAGWSQEDAAVAMVESACHWANQTATVRSSFPFSAALKKHWLALPASARAHTLELDGVPWSFDAVGLRRCWFHSQSLTKRPAVRLSKDRAIAPGVSERTLQMLARLPASDRHACKVLNAIGAPALMNALHVLLKGFVDESDEAWTQVPLKKTMERVLALVDRVRGMDADQVADLAGAVVLAAHGKDRTGVECPAKFVQRGLGPGVEDLKAWWEWVDERRDRVSVAVHARLALVVVHHLLVVAASSTLPPERVGRVVGYATWAWSSAVAQGWDPAALEGVEQGWYQRVAQHHPSLEATVRAALAQHRLHQSWVGPVTAVAPPKRPRL